MQTAVEVHERIVTEAKARAIHEVRHIAKMDIGRVVRQGDIYLHRVDPAHPCGARLESQQLAEGNTQGSRHVCVGAECFAGVETPEWAPSALLGPRLKAGKRFVVEHPEHAHISLPAGDYQITHQMDAATQRRVQD